MLSATVDLRIAAPEDVRALRENWRVSFGDPDDYLDFFFSRRFVPENTLVACVNGRVVSQLFLLPALLHTQDGALRADYLFAAATHPEFRGQGIMAALLSETRAFCSDRGKDAIVLLPGSSALYRYYAACGYETAFFRNRQTVSRAELARLAVPVRKEMDTAAVLQTILSCRDGLIWDADALAYALSEHSAFRGTYASSENAFVALSEDEAVCLCAPQDFGACASLLLELSGQPLFSLTVPADVPIGTRENGGMLCSLSNQPIHLREAFISFAME